MPNASDPDNSPVSNGPHVQDFTDGIGMTHYLGVAAEDGHVWQAKGEALQRDLNKKHC